MRHCQDTACRSIMHDPWKSMKFIANQFSLLYTKASFWMGSIKKTKPRCGLNLFNELQLSPAELWVWLFESVRRAAALSWGAVAWGCGSLAILVQQRRPAQQPATEDVDWCWYKHHLQSDVISCKLVWAHKKGVYNPFALHSDVILRFTLKLLVDTNDYFKMIAILFCSLCCCWWLVMIYYERKVLLGGWWLVLI